MTTSAKKSTVMEESARVFERLLVGLDNSAASRAALDHALQIARAFGSTVTGLHVYAAQIHDHRFRQMEAGLPEQFIEDAEIERQRQVHDTLITRGLEMISDSYQAEAERACSEDGLRFESVNREGRNHLELLAEMKDGEHGLTCIGSSGLGETRHRVTGSVCRRVLLATDGDLLIARVANDETACVRGDGPVVGCVDGSEQSFAAAARAMVLARALDRPLHLVSAYDPHFHYQVFRRIADVLSEEAAKVFRFEEQEKLHNEIIDDGLARIYQGHLDIARMMADDEGLSPVCELLAGKPYDCIDEYARRVGASLLVLGKTGVHGDPGTALGSNTEALLTLAPADLYITCARVQPPADRVAAQTTTWTEEATTALGRVPVHVQPMARMAVQRYAIKQGHTVVTAALFNEASGVMHPGGRVADAGDGGEPGKKKTVGCPHLAARRTKEVPAMDSDAGGENQPSWSDAARARLERVPVGFMRDAARRQVLGLAAERGAEKIELELVEEGLARGRGQMQAAITGDAGAMAASLSGMAWSEDARGRLAQVPEGFMRQLTAQRVENFARQQGAESVTLELVEDKFDAWQRGGGPAEFTLPWDEAAVVRVRRVPPVVRAQVISEVEKNSRSSGYERVSEELFDQLVGDWKNGGDFHHDG